ncbi:MAG: aminoacyl-tRNA hydrolase [Anaerolineae bacterium]
MAAELNSPPPPYLDDGWNVIVGLGNPGSEYALHRHNIGFQCIDALAALQAIPVTRKRFKGLVGEGRIAGRRVALLKPQTFMNDSGASVILASHWYKADPQNIIVVYDDLDLPFGRLRVRPGGGSGGHNGMRSIIRELGSEDFARIRVGIGRPVHGEPVDYVLNAFDREQAPFLKDIWSRVGEIVTSLLTQGLRETMNRYNGLDAAWLTETTE